MIDLHLLNELRITDHSVAQHYGGFGDEKCGVFQMLSPIDGAPLLVIASNDAGWDHISVSRKGRSPNQREMDYVFRIFFAADETAVQYFVPTAEHVNNMPNCLHLWRPHHTALPKPPREFV